MKLAVSLILAAVPAARVPVVVRAAGKHASQVQTAVTPHIPRGVCAATCDGPLGTPLQAQARASRPASQEYQVR